MLLCVQELWGLASQLTPARPKTVCRESVVNHTKIISSHLTPTSSGINVDHVMPNTIHSFKKSRSPVASDGTTPTTSSSSSAHHHGHTNQKSSFVSSYHSQEDAMEFLTFVLNNLHEPLTSINSSSVSSSSPEIPSSSNTSISTIGSNTRSSLEAIQAAILPPEPALDDDSNNEWMIAGNTSQRKAVIDYESKRQSIQQNSSSIISKLFHGTLRSEVTYSNKKISSTTFQQFHSLSLEMIPRNNKVKQASHITQALSNYFACEVLESGKVRKVVTIDHLPHILILQCKRFSFDTFRGVPIKVGCLW